MKFIAPLVATFALFAVSSAHAQTRSASQVTPALESYTNRQLLGDVWKRPGLSPRDRSIVTLAALIARGQAGELPFYYGLALDSGVKPAEISEIISHLVFYAGWPNASSALPAAEDAFTMAFGPPRRHVRGNPTNSALVRTPVAVTIHEMGDGPIDKDANLEAPPVISPTTRREILTRARGYLAVNWTMAPENFFRMGVDNQCAKADGKHWLRPRRFTENTVGKSIGPMPYLWGGGDSPEIFRSKINKGLLAGSVCTCREPEFNYCQVDFAAGVDCSGFVSRSWGISKLGTTTLHRAATAITSLSQLKAGDALNKAGSHVRLFIGFKQGPELQFEVLESATNLRCEGVCASTYTAEELSGYTALRYLGLSE